MKSTSVRPTTSYRNDKVFLSAQRLISSRPLAKRPRRWPKYLALALISISLLTLVREIKLPLQLGTNRTTTNPSASKSALNPQSVATTEDPTASFIAQSDPGLLSPTFNTANQTTSPDSTTTERTAIPVALDIETWLSAITSDITLRGTLSEGSTAPIMIEFALKRRDRAIFGVVRYFSTAGLRVVANDVSGEISGRTLNIAEKNRSWTLSMGASVPSPALLEIGRNFTIALPEIYGAKTLTGSWRLNDKSGALQLSPAPPW